MHKSIKAMCVAGLALLGPSLAASVVTITNASPVPWTVTRVDGHGSPQTCWDQVEISPNQTIRQTPEEAGVYFYELIGPQEGCNATLRLMHEASGASRLEFQRGWNPGSHEIPWDILGDDTGRDLVLISQEAPSFPLSTQPGSPRLSQVPTPEPINSTAWSHAPLPSPGFQGLGLRPSPVILDRDAMTPEVSWSSVVDAFIEEPAKTLSS